MDSKTPRAQPALGQAPPSANHRFTRLAHPGAVALALALWTSAGCEPAQPPSPEPPAPRPTAELPNVLLITVESLRADHVHCYGYERPTTPRIDALAAESVVFTDAHAVTSWTLPSHASLFTGLYPGAHQVVTHRQALHDAYETVAEMLQRRGYQTAAVISGPFLRRTFNLDQGFELYDESPSSYANLEAHDDVTNPLVETAVRRFLTEQRDPDKPFFLFAYYWDPHYDYIPPAPYDSSFVPPGAEPLDVTNYETSDAVNPDITPGQLSYVISQYDGEILWTDAALGRLWELLRSLDLWDNTAVILTSDHGQEFFEHGHKGHQHNLHGETVRVPLIFKRPHQAGAGTSDPRLVSLIDVMPTVAQLADVQPIGPVQGRSLLGPARQPGQPIFFELTTTWAVRTTDPANPLIDLSERWDAVRRGKYKAIVRDLPAQKLLYDVMADPGETRSLTDAQATLFDELRAELARFKETVRLTAASIGATGSATLTPEEEARLRSLGYIR